jgi:S1-C subfamily serine protease
MLFLHERGKLRSFYAEFKSSYKKDKSGRRAVETVLAKPLAKIEKEWLAWAKELKMPWGQSSAFQGRLGLRVRDTKEGVKVIGFDPGSPAETAGRLQSGDIVLEFDGTEIRSTAALVAAIRSAGAMRTVTVGIRRKGRRRVVRQPLGSPKTPTLPLTDK